MLDRSVRPSNNDQVESIILHQGMIYKRGQGGLFHRSTWKVRHVVLMPTTLRYYDFGILKGELDLTHCTRKSIQMLPRDVAFKGNYATLWRFAVDTPNRRMIFSATSEADMNTWIRKLHLAIAVQHNDIRAIEYIETLQGRNGNQLNTPRNARRSTRTSFHVNELRAESRGHTILLQAHQKQINENEKFANKLCSKYYVASKSEVEI